MPELQLIGGPQSPYVWVCRLALAEKRVPYTLVSVMPHTPEVDAIHPFGKIPALRHGEVTLPKMKGQFAVLARATAATGHLVGRSFTLADMDLMPLLYDLSKSPESSAMLAEATELKAYFDRHMARPSVEATIRPPFPGRS